MRQYFSLGILLVLVIATQLITQWTDTAFYLTQLTMCAYYSLLIIGLCTIMGYAGQISLGHAGFFAIGIKHQKYFVFIPANADELRTRLKYIEGIRRILFLCHEKEIISQGFAGDQFHQISI